MRKRWLIPAILLFTLAVLLVTRNHSSDKNASLAQGNRPPSKSQNLLSQFRSQTKAKSNNALSIPRSSIEPSPNFPDRHDHTSKELKNFQISELELSNVSLSEAVEALLQAYADICAHTNEVPLDLNITLPNDLDTRVDFHLLNRSFLSALFTISSAYETTFDLTDTELFLLKISALPPVDPSNQLTRAWVIPPNLEYDLEQLLRTNDIQGAPEIPSKRRTNAELLALLGMVPSGAQASTSDDKIAIVSVQNLHGHQRIDTLIESLRRPSIQHHQESTLISSTDDLGLTSGYYLPDQLDQQLATINSDSNTSLEVAPTVLARPGETATVEVIREVITPAANGGFDNDWVGLQIRSQVDSYGFGYSPKINLESRPGPDSLPATATILGDAQFALSDIAPGSHALVQHQVTPDGQHQYVVTRITQLDATGSPIPPRGESSP